MFLSRALEYLSRTEKSATQPPPAVREHHESACESDHFVSTVSQILAPSCSCSFISTSGSAPLGNEVALAEVDDTAAAVVSTDTAFTIVEDFF